MGSWGRLGYAGYLDDMRHLDLFSGIGGFASAVDTVWHEEENEHIFCDNDRFCQAVLKKHWPEAEIYGDIRILTNSRCEFRRTGCSEATQGIPCQWCITAEKTQRLGSIDLLTGGFPCQPFSQAGRRQGKDDDRYLWPEMLRVIKEFKPTWIIGENVAGILSMAQQQSELGVEGETDSGQDSYDNDSADGIIRGILDDIEQAGYSVQTFVIPACAVNAPHRRDRVWIVAHCNSKRFDSIRQQEGTRHIQNDKERNIPPAPQEGIRQQPEPIAHTVSRNTDSEIQGTRVEDEAGPHPKSLGGDSDASDSERARHTGKKHQARPSARHNRGTQSPDWTTDWIEVAARLCSVDDGLSAWMGDTLISKARHRNEQLKAYGNSIVPQVAAQIMACIKEVELVDSRWEL